MTPSTRSRRKRGEKAARAGKARLDTMVDRLLAVKRTDLVPKSVERAALGKRRPTATQAAQLEDDLSRLRKEIVQVGEIRERLLDVPALTQKVSIL
jgi:hypothetical protein